MQTYVVDRWWLFCGVDLDRANIIAIDVSSTCLTPQTQLPRSPHDDTNNPNMNRHLQIEHNVTPDSLLLLRAAREVVEEEGFDQMLDDVRDRVDEIESLHRTRELTVRLLLSSYPILFCYLALFSYILPRSSRPLLLHPFFLPRIHSPSHLSYRSSLPSTPPLLSSTAFTPLFSLTLLFTFTFFRMFLFSSYPPAKRAK